MKIENTKVDKDKINHSLEANVRPIERAREIIASTPWAGVISWNWVVEVLSNIDWWTVAEGAGGAIALKGLSTAGEYFFPPDEKDPFKMGLGHEIYSTKHWTDIRKGKWREPPVFHPHVAQLFQILQKAPKEAAKNQKLLPHALFMGPIGTGKSSACEVIARNSGVNYFVIAEAQFIDFAQDQRRADYFFSSLRSLSVPTVLVIDDAKSLLERNKTDPGVLKAFEAFKRHSHMDGKIMFLFTTEMNKQEIDPRFLDRMNYQLTIQMPGPEELKKIISQHAKSYSSLAGLFDQETIEYLVDKKVFSGESGRAVHFAIMWLSEVIGSLSTKKPLKEEIQNLFIGYFKEHRNAD